MFNKDKKEIEDLKKQVYELQDAVALLQMCNRIYIPSEDEVSGIMGTHSKSPSGGFTFRQITMNMNFGENYYRVDVILRRIIEYLGINLYRAEEKAHIKVIKNL